eukprot:6180606-Pleurochrysis_carterae.AAC.5
MAASPRCAAPRPRRAVDESAVGMWDIVSTNGAGSHHTSPRHGANLADALGELTTTCPGINIAEYLYLTYCLGVIREKH